MKNNIALFCIVVLVSCSGNQATKHAQHDDERIKTNIEDKQFNEVGDSLLVAYDFPEKWYNGVFDEGHAMSKNDSVIQQKFDKLDFFDKINGKKKLGNNAGKEYMETKKNVKIDSIIEFDSSKIGHNKLVYIKSYKTFLDTTYDFPPTERSVDILFYHNNKFQKKVNVYKEVNYPFSVDVKLGYLNKNGILTTKKFEIYEESVNYIGTKTEDLNKFLKQ